MGVGLFVYSLTKYMDGHTDVLMGSIFTNREDLKERLAYLHNGKDIYYPAFVKSLLYVQSRLFFFFVSSPFDCHLMIRNLRARRVPVPLRFSRLQIPSSSSEGGKSSPSK